VSGVFVVVAAVMATVFAMPTVLVMATVVTMPTVVTMTTMIVVGLCGGLCPMSAVVPSGFIGGGRGFGSGVPVVRMRVNRLGRVIVHSSSSRKSGTASPRVSVRQPTPAA